MGHLKAAALAVTLVVQFTPAAFASAQFVPERTWNNGLWVTYLYRNLRANRLFCAAETSNGDTYFRLNKYKDSGEAFLEIYNPNWTLMEGNARFSITFLIGDESFDADFAGKSWGDSLTHDFTDKRNYDAILGLLSKSRSLNIRNANGTSIAQFGGDGSDGAISSFETCISG